LVLAGAIATRTVIMIFATLTGFSYIVHPTWVIGCFSSASPAFYIAIVENQPGALVDLSLSFSESEFPSFHTSRPCILKSYALW
jgi:hypothetical protein